MKQRLFLLVLLAAVFGGCNRDENFTVRHNFPDRTWYRFNILQFEVPVEQSENPVNIVFFASIGKDYPFDSLAFNMVMKTPSGEERVKECSMDVKDRNGQFKAAFTGDSCEMTYMLRREVIFDRSGTLTIELENLLPRMRTTGLNGVGIRLQKP